MRNPAVPAARTATDTAEPVSPEQQLTVTVTEPRSDVRVMRVSGEIDLCTTDRLSDSLYEQVSRLPAVLVLEFSGVSFLSVSGIAILDRVARFAERYGVRLRMVAETRAVRRPMELVLLTRRIRCYSYLRAALDGR